MDASLLIQPKIKVIVRLDPKKWASKKDKHFWPNLSTKGLEPPNKNFKGRTLNHHSKLDIQIKIFLREEMTSCPSIYSFIKYVFKLSGMGL